MYTRYHDAYESYYEHLCCIADEKDVLDRHVKGKGWIAALKRRWHDLFLLSYTDPRSRHYYRSSHAMKVARATHFRRNRECIHPLSKFRRNWDFLIVHILIFTKILFHQNTSLIINPSIYYHYTAVVFEAIIIADIFVNLKTGYTVKTTRQVVMDSHQIFMHYLSTTLFMHAASAIPLEFLMFIKYGQGISCSPCKCNLFIGTLKLINIISTLRVFEASRYWEIERNSFKMTAIFKFVRIIVVGMVVVVQILTFVDGLNIIRIVRTNRIDPRSYISVILTYRYGGEMKETDFIFFCAIEFSRICKSFLLFGYGLQPNESTFDQLCALLSFSTAYTFHMWSFITCYACITRQTFSEDQIIQNQSWTLNILRARKLPDHIHAKVNQYYESKMSSLTLTENQNLLCWTLPQTLKNDIKLSCYRRLLTRMPFFAEWPFEVVNGLVSLLTVESFLSDDVVASGRAQSDGLIIVELGMLAVYSVDLKETGHLIDGDYFGELSLVTDKEMRMSDVVAVTYCKILFLSKARFRKLMRNYPKLFFELKRSFLGSLEEGSQMTDD